MHAFWNVPELVEYVLENFVRGPEVGETSHLIHKALADQQCNRHGLDPAIFAVAQVAKFLERPAAALIWRTLDLRGVEDLETLFVDSEHQTQGDGLCACGGRFTNEISPLVRHLSLEHVDEGLWRTCDVMSRTLTRLETISHHCANPGPKVLFPNLHSLHLYFPLYFHLDHRWHNETVGWSDTMNWALNFLRPGLKRLTLWFLDSAPNEVDRNVSIVLNTMSVNLSNLASFRLYFPRKFLPHMEQWAAVLRALEHLQEIELTTDLNLLGTPILGALAGHLHLASVRIGAPNYPKTLQVFTGDVRVRGFDALRSLRLSQLASISSMTTLFESLSKSTLASLSVVLDMVEPGESLWSHLSKFTEILAKSQPGLKSLSLELQWGNSRDWPQEFKAPTEVRWTPFRSLLALREITRFDFLSNMDRDIPFDFNDTDLKDMAHSWTSIEQLRLLWTHEDPYQRRRSPNVTINGLEPLSTCCPRLASLHFQALNAEGCNFVPPSQVGAGGLLEIRIERITFEWPLQVAAYLTCLWPQMTLSATDACTVQPGITLSSVVFAVQGFQHCNAALYKDNPSKAFDMLKLILCSEDHRNSVYARLLQYRR